MEAEFRSAVYSVGLSLEMALVLPFRLNKVLELPFSPNCDGVPHLV